jgi:thiol peroxidase
MPALKKLNRESKQAPGSNKLTGFGFEGYDPVPEIWNFIFLLLSKGDVRMEKNAGVVALEERKGEVTFKGKPVTLVGPRIHVGQRAPEFKLMDPRMKEVTLSQTKGKVRLISVVYSLETPVCDLQTKTFEEEAAKYPDVVIYSVSMDLPFTQARYSQERNIRNLKFLSDHRDASFGMAYGVLIKETRLLARAVYIIDADDMVRYVEYVKEVTQAPDYEKAVAALKDVKKECFGGD